MSDVFIDALRYPFADRAQVDGITTCFAVLLVGGTLLRLAARLRPDLTFPAPALAAAVPLVVFFGLVGDVLVDDGFPPLAVTETLKPVGRVVGVASVYLFPAAVTVVAVGYVTVTGSTPVVLIGVTTAMSATVALLVTVVCAYLLPAATAVDVHGGPHAGFRRNALRGAASGVHFFTWVDATVLVALAWSAFAAAISRSVVALLALGWCAYTHITTAALVAGGVGRTTPW